jgi:hypothetical protein
MHRLSPCLLLLAATPAAADDSVREGTRVRLATKSESIVGNLVQATSGNLIVERDGRRIEIPARTVTELEASEGLQPQTVRGGVLGFFFGLGAGGIATLAIGRGGDENDLSLEYTLAPAALAGAVIGAVVGHFIEREEWKTVDAKTVQLVPSGKGDGVSLVIGTSF